MIEVYTKDDCSYCQQAKSLLDERKVDFVERKLYVDFTRETLLEKYPFAKSFPVVVVDGYFIGGYSQLREHLEVPPSTAVLLNE